MTTPTYISQIEFSDGLFTDVTSLMQKAYITRAIADGVSALSNGRAIVELSNDGGFFNDNFRENIFPYSETASTWSRSSSLTIANSLLVAPNSKSTGIIISDVGSSSLESLDYVTDNDLLTGNEILTASTFIHKDSTPSSSRFPEFKLEFHTSSGNNLGHVSAFLDTMTGSLSVATQQASATDYGVETWRDSWWRIFITGYSNTTSIANKASLWIYPAYGKGTVPSSANYNSSAIGSIGIWGMQMNRGNIKPYTPTSGAASAASFPYLPIGKRLRIQATESGSTRDLFNGYMQAVDFDAHLGNRTATFNCYDIIQKISRANVDSDLYTNTQVDSLVFAICSLAGVGSMTSIDVIPDAITYYWANNEAADRSLKRLIDYGHHYLYGSADGDIHFRHRNSYGSATPVGSYNEFFGFTSTFDESRIFNDVTITGQARKLATTQATLAWIVTPIQINANDSQTFWLNYIDPAVPTTTAPAKNMATPTKSADWLLFVNSDGTGSNLTSNSSAAITFFGESAKCTVYNNASSAAYLTKFQLQGFSIQAAPSIRQTVVDSNSINLYGDKQYALDSDLIYSSAYAKKYGQFLIDNYKEATPIISAGLKNIFPDVLDIDVGKTLAINNSFMLVNSIYLTKQIAHSIDVTQRGVEHELQMVLQITNIASF